MPSCNPGGVGCEKMIRGLWGYSVVIDYQWLDLSNHQLHKALQQADCHSPKKQKGFLHDTKNPFFGVGDDGFEPPTPCL